MKKTVIYSSAEVPPVVGERAYVYPINHPDIVNVSNTCLVRTSPVIRLGYGGEFETENTVYVQHLYAH